jgi:hypothetical protein
LEMHTGIRIEFRKRIYQLIEDNVSRDINPTSSIIKALEPFVHVAIPEKNTLFGPELEFVSVKWLEIGPTCTSKTTQATIVRFFMEQPL